MTRRGGYAPPRHLRCDASASAVVVEERHVKLLRNGQRARACEHTTSVPERSCEPLGLLAFSAEAAR